MNRLKAINIFLIVLVSITAIYTVHAVNLPKSIYTTISLSLTTSISTPIINTINLSFSVLSSSPPIYNRINLSLKIGILPTLATVTLSGLSDTNNVYSQLTTYTATLSVRDLNGYSDITSLDLEFISSGVIIAVIHYVENTDVATVTTGSDKIELISCTPTKSGYDVSLVILFKTKWLFESMPIRCHAYAIDTTGFSMDGVGSGDYDFINTIMLYNSGVTISGNDTIYGGEIRYNNHGVASSSYPPNAEFTNIKIHDVAHGILGTDSTVVNGVYSITIVKPVIVGEYYRHVYADMADADYTDADLYGFNSLVILNSGSGGGDVTLNVDGNAVIELDGVPVTTPDSFTLTSGLTYNITAYDILSLGVTLNVTGSANIELDGVPVVTPDSYLLSDGSTYVLDANDIPSLGVTLDVTGSANIELDGVPVVTPDSYLLSDGSTYVLDANDIPSLGVTLDVTGNANINLDGVPVVTPDSFALIDGNTYALDALNIGGSGGSFGTQAMFFFGMIALILFLITRKMR